MPWCEVPPHTLGHITLFGFRVLVDEDDDHMIIECEGKGKIVVCKKRPKLWVDDIEDAMQMGAIAIITDA